MFSAASNHTKKKMVTKKNTTSPENAILLLNRIGGVEASRSSSEGNIFLFIEKYYIVKPYEYVFHLNTEEGRWCLSPAARLVWSCRRFEQDTLKFISCFLSSLTLAPLCWLKKFLTAGYTPLLNSNQ